MRWTFFYRRLSKVGLRNKPAAELPPPQLHTGILEQHLLCSSKASFHSVFILCKRMIAGMGGHTVFIGHMDRVLHSQVKHPYEHGVGTTLSSCHQKLQCHSGCTGHQAAWIKTIRDVDEEAHKFNFKDWWGIPNLLAFPELFLFRAIYPSPTFPKQIPKASLVLLVWAHYRNCTAPQCT